jgi:hypothetical protein
MVGRLRRCSSRSTALLVAWSAFAIPHANAQWSCRSYQNCCPPPPCPAPAVPQPRPAQPPTPTPTSPSVTQPSEATPATPQAPPLPEQAQLASTGSNVAVSAPNMIGHLLFGSRSVEFRYNRAAGPINVANYGSTSLINAAVADNNSPLPEDRLAFRFNYFDNAQHITGFGPAIFNAQGVGTAFAQTRDFSVEEYTFSVEKTFLDGWGSVELRVPFNTGLSSNLNLSAGTITGPTNSDGSFPVTSTPGQTLGTEGTQFGDLTLIFKSLVYKSCPWAISAGLAIGFPTGDDTNVQITDFSGMSNLPVANLQRQRVIHIDNEIWSLSPFLAALYMPNDRFFAQGFVQFDFPLNDSTINYSDRFLRGGVSPAEVQFLTQAGILRAPTLIPPFSVRSGISEQPLVQIDVGTGYWLFKDPSCTWITGIAPTVELHYTSTLKNASVVGLPGDPLLQNDPTTGHSIQEQPPRVGNLNNRIDILDLTVGSTFLISNSTTLAAAFSFPLRQGADRTFDWEFQFQFNYYFGARGVRVPNF